MMKCFKGETMKEEIEKYYKDIKTNSSLEYYIEKDELIKNIVSIYLTMNNFEPELEDKMKNKVAEIKDYIEQLEKERDGIYDDYQDIGKKFFELDEKVQEVIDSLKQDIWTRCRQNYPNSSLAFSEMRLLNKRDQEILDMLEKGENNE